MTGDNVQPQSPPADAVLTAAQPQDNMQVLSEVLGADPGSAGAVDTAGTLGTETAVRPQEAHETKVDKGFQGRVNAEVKSKWRRQKRILTPNTRRGLRPCRRWHSPVRQTRWWRAGSSATGTWPWNTCS